MRLVDDSLRSLFDQGFRGTAQPAVQFPSHGHGQRTLPIEYLVNPIRSADIGHEVFDRQVALLHHQLDRLNRVREIKRKMLRFVCFHERGENVEVIALGRASLGCHQGLDGSKGGFVVPFVSDGLDFHFRGCFQIV